MSFMRKLFGGDEPLAGAPAIRRPKTHSADSGYVYEYVFRGFRKITRPPARGYQYVFEVSGNRRDRFEVSVFLSRQLFTDWAASHQGREFSASERFAIAKIALRRAFDSAPRPSDLHDEVRPSEPELAEIAKVLDLG